tara:strand:- start:1900 stop:2085 length:186 start_codon:yes stop_codon:yes gene_type:complete
MERMLSIKKGYTEIEFDDLDSDNEMGIDIINGTLDITSTIYLDKENLNSLKKHIDRILEKM